MSENKKWVRVVNGPVMVGREVVQTKGYAHATADEADALALVGYVKVVPDAEGEAAAAKVSKTIAKVEDPEPKK